MSENSGDENDRRYIPFTVRYRMFHEQPNQKFLVYLTEPAPAVQDNWLLDLERAYGPTFTMDKLAVTFTETLPEASADTRNKWLEVMKRVPKFFDSEERAKRFAKRLNTACKTSGLSCLHNIRRVTNPASKKSKKWD